VGIPMSPLPIPEDNPPSEDPKEMAAYQIERARALALASGGKNEALPALLLIAQAQVLLYIGGQIERLADSMEVFEPNHGDVHVSFGDVADDVIQGIGNTLNSIDNRLR
jgi:hypothetical protein